jgi:NADH:ubiquinone reductase (non-electrogenic)
LSEARQIRQGIIDCFELAITPGLSAADRERLLHFVVVGGGPTGVEFAAELHDFLTEDLRKWYPNLIDDVQITLVEAGKGLLSTFHERLGDYAAKTFQRARIEVLTNSPVREVREREIVLQDETHIPFGLAVWSTGNGPTTLVSSSGFERNKRQRILVDDHLHVLGQTNIFALGDCAASGLQELPATAQVAQQMGKYLAKAFNDRARGKPARPFVFKNMGMLAYIGSRKALADLPNLQGSGFGTWLFWRSAYLTKLVSTKNKCLVIFDWFKTMIFGRDISRF